MDTKKENARAHLLISGRVQGVCFRMFTEEEAKKLGLMGWVRNLPSGKVEAVFEGPKTTIEIVIAWCHQGPTAARVDKVQVTWEEFLGEFLDFKTVR